MGDYLPLFRPGDTVTFDVTTAVKGGDPVQVGAADWSVAPCEEGSSSYIGVAGHDAAVGDKVTVEIGRPIHEFVAAEEIAAGRNVQAATGGKVMGVAGGDTIGLTLAAAAGDGSLVPVLQR